jgi:hypothetical protein
MDYDVPFDKLVIAINVIEGAGPRNLVDTAPSDTRPA